MQYGPVAVLDEQPPPPSEVTFAARRTRPVLRAWRVGLWLAEWSGRGLRRVLVDWLGPLVIGLLALGLVWATEDHWERAGIAASVAAILSIGAAGLTARRRLLIGDFSPLDEGMKDGLKQPSVDLATLLQVELSRLGSLFRVVEDRRAVSSGLGPGGALDATLSVDDLAGTLQETVSAETKVSFGPVSIPVAPLVALAGRAVRAPRLTGNLHRDGDVLILTAQQGGRGGLSWRVSARVRPVTLDRGGLAPAEEAAPDERALLSEMVSELALRIFTDLALGRDVRWQASQYFVQGLHKFRACLRTPKDRKVNLKDAERLLLNALSEDEDFPRAYYNLGVVYTELHGLADAAGRREEAEMHLSAAETSFGRAIDKDPTRSDTYLALAQTQLRYRRYGTVLELCDYIKQIDSPAGDRARAHELQARALLSRGEAGDLKLAIKHARGANSLALRSLLVARLSRRAAPGDEGDRVPRCAELAGACALTFGVCYARQLPAESALADRGLKRWRQEAVVRRVGSLFGLAQAVTVRVAHLHFDLGLRALGRGRVELAERELKAAVQGDPTRPTYTAALALARVRRKDSTGALADSDRADILSLCQRALQAMAGAFFPSRDAQACELVARVYDELGGHSPRSEETRVAQQLRTVEAEVERRLADAVSEASVSAYFLEALQRVQPPWKGELGQYGAATREARSLLLQGQRGLLNRQEDVTLSREEALTTLRNALKEAERATSLNPLSSLAWDTLGDVYGELSDFRNARRAWEYALSRDPDNPELYDKIGTSHWNLAFEGRNGVLAQELEKAEAFFQHALLLYGSGSFDEQIATHYRLGKLYTALRRFADARPHLQIVEAVDKPPIVGWYMLGMAHLEERNYSECEYHFGRVIAQGREFARNPEQYPPEKIVGDRLDEKLWPLALIRAWGHLGMAFSYLERDGNLAKAGRHVREARTRAAELPNPDAFPTRIHAACSDCEGFIYYRMGEVADAIAKLEESVGEYPWSRSYIHLALAYEERAREDPAHREADLRAAKRFLDHATSLGPTISPTPEVEKAVNRLESLPG